MSNDEIVKWLRDLACEWVECCGDIHLPLSAAADHIEELEAKLAHVNATLESAEKANPPKPGILRERLAERRATLNDLDQELLRQIDKKKSS